MARWDSIAIIISPLIDFPKDEAVREVPANRQASSAHTAQIPKILLFFRASYAVPTVMNRSSLTAAHDRTMTLWHE
ncbi:hypothetical protein CEV32_1560 [Brucella rhizosphaerae]|uniref:Uncharacterized protein n=1 Tax=Brucella rhizosphaerae TaxID=571254 RepID=A0A256F8U6_9HYPH|nr:hypothetical protein CEV32_1560 [Brucella rhizosphaerae]